MGGDEGSVQLHQVGVMKPLQQLVFSQHQKSLLCLVRADLGSKHLAGFSVPAQVYYAETAPGETEDDEVQRKAVWQTGVYEKVGGTRVRPQF